MLLSTHRNLESARAFFTRARRAGAVPVEVATDPAAAYPRVVDELAWCQYGQARYAAAGIPSWVNLFYHRRAASLDALNHQLPFAGGHDR